MFCLCRYTIRAYASARSSSEFIRWCGVPLTPGRQKHNKNGVPNVKRGWYLRHTCKPRHNHGIRMCDGFKSSLNCHREQIETPAVAVVLYSYVGSSQGWGTDVMASATRLPDHSLCQADSDRTEWLWRNHRHDRRCCRKLSDQAKSAQGIVFSPCSADDVPR